MKDGFDRSVAEKMPRMQKKRPNRPWNVDPVLMKAQDEEKVAAEAAFNAPSEKPLEKPVEKARIQESFIAQIKKPLEDKPEPEIKAGVKVEQEPVAESPLKAETKPVASVEAVAEPASMMESVPASDIPKKKNEDIVKAVETIKELNSDFTQMIFDRKAIQQQLDKSASSMDEVVRENARLKASLVEVENKSLDNTMIEREIDFLNEQLEDADLYIQNMVGLLEEKMQTLDQEQNKRKELEGRFTKIGREIQDKAKMDVKISILERDLSISGTRIRELESKLEEEYQKREPLELEITELKNALDRVYSSLAHIRLKAKREVYGS